MIPLVLAAGMILHSTFFDWDALSAKPSRDGQVREVFDAPTPTLKRLSLHITTMVPGPMAPPHHHPEEEIALIKEGTGHYWLFGQTHEVPEGGMVFLAADALHTPFNPGTRKVEYYVIEATTERTPSQPGEGADKWAPADELHSSFFDCRRVPAIRTPFGSRRRVVDSPTPTLVRLESHITTLKPGAATRRSVDPADELVFILSGRVEVTIAGVSACLAAGSFYFRASNDPHETRNVGGGPASYQTVRFVTAKTPKPRDEPGRRPG